MEIKPVFISKHLYKVLPDVLLQKLQLYKSIEDNFLSVTRSICPPRFSSALAWNIDPEPMHREFQLAPNTDLTFAKVTDARAIQFHALLQSTGKKLGVLWSGGVDSSVIVAALVKHFTSAELRQITIFMNNTSYYEHPEFYHNIICKNNFQIRPTVDVQTIDLNQLLDEYIITDGEQADKLWYTWNAMKYVDLYGPNSLLEDIDSAKLKILNFLNLRLGEIHGAQFYKMIIDSIQETSAWSPTIANFFWWIGHNFNWSPPRYYWYRDSTKDDTSRAYNNYLVNFIRWFDTVEYESWSFFNATLWHTQSRNFSKFKNEAKQYVHDITGTSNYVSFDFRPKIMSMNRTNHTLFVHSPIVIFNNGDLLYANETLKVKQFIQDHCLLA